MRNYIKSPLLWTLGILSSILISLASIVSCRHMSGRHSSDLDTVAINPAFATHPPIAQDVTIQKLQKESEEGNTLMKATFSSEEIGSPYLAFMADDKKVVLRDDGVSPDEKKGDGVYTGVVMIDMARLKNIQEEQNRQKGEAIPVTLFQGRIITGTQRVEVLDLNRFFDGEILRLHFPLFWTTAAIFNAVLANSVTVNATSVVEDPTRTYDPCSNAGTKMGPWTFGFLMAQLANTPSTGVSPSRFVMNWLLTYTKKQSVNKDSLDIRPKMAAFIHNWLVASSGLTDSTLDLSIAPFRLMAIVNRLDLRANTGYLGNGGNAGEGRFVFCALDNSCGPALFTVIFEYGINKTTCPSIKAYAQEWYDLKDLTIGSSAYNTALQHITDQFSMANTNPSKPNGSSLDQLRTNEIALGSSWELREFNIDPTLHTLFDTTVKQTPQAKFDHQPIIDTFLRQKASLIKTNTHIIPLVYHFNGTDTNFLAAMAPEPPLFWVGNVAVELPNDTVREMFSLNTCNGCHNLETGASFLQISPAISFGSPASLSGFLTGTTVIDPAEIPGTWKFADLQRRAQDLIDLVNSPCLFIPLHFRPLNMVH
jgi:hypothetical protein